MTSTSAYPVVKGALVSTENYTWNTADSLGKGASAVVYLGRHKVGGKYAAVKVFHDRVYQGYKTDDLRELELMRQLKHPNIITLLAKEQIVSSKKVVIVMEYCEGGSLHHLLDQPQNYHGLAEEEFLLVLGHVCSGMEYLQQEHVIHRDIKPGNIMRWVTDDGFSVYKLTDFGAARNLFEDENFQSLYGTEEYLHPGMYERAVLRLPNSQSFDAKVDLWSLGVTFFHTATGQLPFQPYGGRSNRRTMFEIITQKESGVISGIQSTENGPIQWKRDLPDSSPLSNGLKSIVIPMLAGLMEPDANKMITHQSLFRMVNNIKQKITISIFDYNKCEELMIYAEPDTTLSGLQDLIASRTDIVASDQILIVGGKTLQEVVDPLSSLRDYPSHIHIGSIYLFQREMTEVHNISEPEMAPMPTLTLTDLDADARLAHNCSSWGELLKRHQEKVSKQQERLVSGMFYLRLYVESRLEATKASHEYVQHLLTECNNYVGTCFDLIETLRCIVATKRRSQQNVQSLSTLLDQEIKQALVTASGRMGEIDKYRENLAKKMYDIKVYASKFSAACSDQKCGKKIVHHLSVISGVYNRFRRDKNVKDQMTPHDVDIHRFEGQKLHSSCQTLKSIVTEHCRPQMEVLYKTSIHVCESLTKSLTRVMKIDKNLAIVQKCVNMIIGKLQGLKDFGIQCGSEEVTTAQDGHLQAAELGPSFEMMMLSSRDSSVRGTGSKPERMTSLSDQVDNLKEKLQFVSDILDQNSTLLVLGRDETSEQSSDSLQHRLGALSELDRDNT
uniref:Protein kinase domain-containing protein n=1 Tax=Arion vulgaris TaxID=1028688 RepID=A0A0B6ZP08_9EUPU